MKEPVFQSTFVGGELSPHMQDRIDIEIYSAGAARLRNFIPLPHGPIMRRQGSQYLATANAAVKFIPFSFSVEQSFMLEFSHLKMRVYYQDLIVLGQDGVTPFELVTPWRDIDLPNLCWAVTLANSARN